QQQAASVEQVASTFDEFSAMIDTVAGNAVTQYQSTDTLRSRIEDLSAAMENITRNTQQTLDMTAAIALKVREGEKSMIAMNQSMTVITASSSEMTGIIRIINEISDRINLLSLNATIEAARAGDSGRGFAVVADEVSKLADQTASSIKDIDRLIRGNTDEIQAGTCTINTMSEIMKGIIEGVDTINTTIAGITGHMNEQAAIKADVSREAGHTHELAGQIKTAGGEMKMVTGEIMSAIDNINELTQKNADNAGRLAGTADEVNSVALELKAESGSLLDL
ncbi:MAG: methyl-accepting chemotaxis protein, partial [Spirochaetota bacterium]